MPARNCGQHGKGTIRRVGADMRRTTATASGDSRKQQQERGIKFTFLRHGRRSDRYLYHTLCRGVGWYIVNSDLVMIDDKFSLGDLIIVVEIQPLTRNPVSQTGLEHNRSLKKRKADATFRFQSCPTG